MSFFGDIFSKKDTIEQAVDLSVLKTDIHSHLIPGIDDGSKSMDDTIAMILEFQKLGYQKIITTPHIMSDFYRNTSDIILRGRDEVRAELHSRSIDMEFDVAAEYYLDEYFEELIEKKDLLTFGDNYVLFELSFLSEPMRINEVIFELQTAGYNPVLAHPERYNYFNDKISNYERFIDRGVILQLNINSLSGGYSPEGKKMAVQLIENNMIEMIGSDCHFMGHIDSIKNQSVFMKSFKQLIDSGRLINSSL